MKFEMDLISVIIPCFNSGSTIMETIDSVKKQTWKNIEIIVIDDGSNEKKTQQTLQKIRGIKLIRQKNFGLPAARNKGISKSKGKYILPLDADDSLHPNALEIMHSKVRKNKSKNFVFSNILLKGERRGLIKKKYNFFNQLFVNNVPYCILFSKSIWSEIGGYDEKMLKGFEDWEFNIHLGKKGYYGECIDEPLFHYFVNKDGMLLSKSINHYGQIWSYIQSKHKDLYSVSMMLRTWKNWRNSETNNLTFFCIILIAFHKTLPLKIFNIIIKNLLKIKKLFKKGF